MSVTIADITFQYHDYDERGDTLFLGVNGPSDSPPEGTYRTPDGHVVELDETGSVVAIELMGPRGALERDGELRLTLREYPAVASASDLAPALAR